MRGRRVWVGGLVGVGWGKGATDLMCKAPQGLSGGVAASACMTQLRRTRSFNASGGCAAALWEVASSCARPLLRHGPALFGWVEDLVW